jgi:hypothetical protein
MDQIQQQLEQLQQIPGIEDFEGLVGGKLESLGGGTASQFFQTLARQASAQQAQRQGLGFDDQQLSNLGNSGRNVNPLALNSIARPSRIGDNSSIDAQLRDLADIGGGGGYFEDRIFAIMCKIVEDMQKKIEERLKKLQADAEKAEAAGKEDESKKGDGQESRNIEFEKIKFDMQKLSQMQQAMSNVLNTMDELAKSAIRQIKAG